MRCKTCSNPADFGCKGFCSACFVEIVVDDDHERWDR